MLTEETLANRDGNHWIVEHCESERLTHIGGFLMTYNGLGCIIISSSLTDVDKARGREVLRRHLVETPIGTSGTVLWHPGDELHETQGLNILS